MADESVLEVSTFNFFYSSGGVGVTIDDGSRTSGPVAVGPVEQHFGSPISIKDVVNSIKRCFKHILISSRKLPKLPGKYLFFTHMLLIDRTADRQTRNISTSS